MEDILWLTWKFRESFAVFVHTSSVVKITVSWKKHEEKKTLFTDLKYSKWKINVKKHAFLYS